MEIEYWHIVLWLFVNALFLLYINPLISSNRWVQKLDRGLIPIPTNWMRALDRMVVDIVSKETNRVVEGLETMSIEIDPDMLQSVMMKSLGGIKGQLSQQANSKSGTAAQLDIQDALMDSLGPGLLESVFKRNPTLGHIFQYALNNPEEAKAVADSLGSQSGDARVTSRRRYRT